MQYSRLLFALTLLLAPVALLSTTWLYLYPIFHGCAFPTPPANHTESIAPFRLLALGDPQLEGDSKLPNPNAPIFPSVEYLIPHLQNAESNAARLEMLKQAGLGVVKDGLRWLEGYRKAIDLWGNDWYLAHIVRTLRWWTVPSHVAVLGDLLGSQWITDGEFEKRAGRYWNVVMKGLEKVPERVYGKKEEEELMKEEVTEIAVEQVPESVEETKDTVEHISGNLQQALVERGDQGQANSLDSNDPNVSSMNEINEGESYEIKGDPKKEENEDNEEATAKEDAQDNNEKTRDIDSKMQDMNEIEKNENQHNQGHVNSEEIQVKSEDENHEESQDGQKEAISEESHDTHEIVEDAILDILEVQNENQASQDDFKKDESGSILGDTSQEEIEENHEAQAEESEEEHKEESKPPRKPLWGGTTEILGAEKAWERRVINIAGNHDVGYAGDLDLSRIERFEKAFGSVNWDIWFTLPPNDADSDETPPALRLVILNTMNIDTPAWSYELQTETYSFMNHIITSARPVEDKTHATILLTHIPLEKQAGICVDAPFFNFFDTGQGLREQNMLSDHSSRTVLEGVFGMSSNYYAPGNGLGRRGIVLNGHDHAGCDVVHFIRQAGMEEMCSVDQVKKAEAYWPTSTSTSTTTTTTSVTTTMDEMVPEETSSPNESNPLIRSRDEGTSPASYSEPVAEEPSEPERDPAQGWRAHRFPHLPYSITHNPNTNTSSCTAINESPRLREITLRSMMGDFSGHAGFLSAWFDPSIGDKGEWVFEFASCGLGVQHWWWGVHSVDFALVVISLAAVITRRVERAGPRKDQDGKAKLGKSTSNNDQGKTNGSLRKE